MRKKNSRGFGIAVRKRGQPQTAVAPPRSSAQLRTDACPRLEGFVRVDLHIHTIYSPDCLTTPESIIRWADLHEIDMLAITDHNTIDGALAVRDLAPSRVIVGEEISTPEGELIGLFLQGTIPPQPTLEAALCAIREQDGLTFAPHPCDRARGSAMGSIALQRIAARLDIIETLNARVMLRADNLQALALAEQHGILCAAGSDAHHGAEIGRVHADMPPFTNAASLLRSLAQATLGGRESHPIVHANSTYARVVKQLTRWQKE